MRGERGREARESGRGGWGERERGREGSERGERERGENHSKLWERITLGVRDPRRE